MYPANLWQGADPAADPQRQWRCLHTKPRQEKASPAICGSKNRSLSTSGHSGEPYAQRSFDSLSHSSVHRISVLFGYDRHRVEVLKFNSLVSVLEVADQPNIGRDLANSSSPQLRPTSSS